MKNCSTLCEIRTIVNNIFIFFFAYESVTFHVGWRSDELTWNCGSMKNVLNRPETFSTDSTTSNHRSTLGRRKRKVLGNWKLHSQHNFPSPTACSSSYTDIDVIYSLDRAIFFVFSLAKDNQSTSLTRASSTRKNDGAKRKSDKRRTKLNERTNKKLRVSTLQNWTVAKHLNNFKFSAATIQWYRENMKR